MVPAVSRPFRGRAQGRRNLTRTWGGCQAHPFHFSLARSGFSS